MIDPKELRIGNYINVDDYYPFAEVILISKDDISVDYNSWHFESVSPIKLTEEWLLKLGFVAVEGEIWCRKHDDYEDVTFFYFDRLCIHIDESRDYFTDDNFDFDLKIKHVHELQNLYFALTGEELTIK